MRKKILLVAITAISLVSLFGCSSPGITSNSLNSNSASSNGSVLAADAANYSGYSQNSGVWVTGEGKVTATPDLIILSLGVEAQETTVAAAQAKAVAAMNDIQQILLQQGIAEKDIQTQYFNISKVTRWSQDKNQEEVVGYRVTNMVTVKIRQLDSAGTIIDAVTSAAGDLTRIDNITFTVEDPTPYYNQAREKAMQDAIAKANQVAALANIVLDKPTYISVNTSGIPSPIRAYDSYSAAAGVSSATTINPGELDIQTTVSVAFGIK